MCLLATRSGDKGSLLPTGTLTCVFVTPEKTDGLRALSYFDVGRSERSVEQNVRISLDGEQDLNIYGQSVAVCAPIRHVCNA